MAYRLKLNAPLAQEVRRIAVEQIEIARGALAHCDDRDAAVHDARRSLKRLRPLLRLIRPDVHCKGTDYTIDSVPERSVVLEYGGRTAIVGDPKQHATRELIARIARPRG